MFTGWHVGQIQQQAFGKRSPRYPQDSAHPIRVLECDAMTESDKSQSDKFKEAARENEADEDEARWEERLKRVVKGRDAPVPPPPGPLREKPEKSG
jgi:hypothetical protein